MKTIEEKAKAYDSIIEKANKMHSENCEACKACIEELIPELKESEDEKVRKEIIDFLKLPHPQFVGKRDHEKWIAWLEKQGQKDILEDVILDGNEDGLIAETIRFKKEKQSEQEPADTVEPKFKVGDWVVQGCNILKIRCVGDEYYCFETVGGYVDDMLVSEIDSLYHLWTIKDAKDGDILANDNEIVIFKENNFNQKDLSGCMFVYCSLRDKKGYWYTIGGINPSNYVPATKEQRDLLFQKMHKAGYEWNAETKELRKFEQKPADSYCQENCKGFQETGKCFADGECKAKRESDQKPEKNKGNIGGISPNWSEEDEMVRKDLIGFFKDEAFLCHKKKQIIAWLKKQGDSPIKWNKNTKDCKPQKNHSVLMKTIHGIAEGEWQGEKWFQYRWSSSIKDSDVLFWIELSDIEKQGETFPVLSNSSNSGKNEQKPAEWSEEDKKIINGLIDSLTRISLNTRTDSTSPNYTFYKEIDWLKSLRPQSRWKPSELQLGCLSDAIEYYNSLGYPASKLKELLNDLKKLKECV